MYSESGDHIPVNTQSDDGARFKKGNEGPQEMLNFRKIQSSLWPCCIARNNLFYWLKNDLFQQLQPQMTVKSDGYATFGIS